MKPIRQEIRDIKRQLQKFKCCVQSVISGETGITGATYVATVTTDLVAGTNTIAHGVAGTIKSVFFLDGENRKLEFADERFDNTNVYVYSNEDIANVKIVLFYEV